MRVEQLSLFKQGAEVAKARNECYCWYSIDFGAACDVCRWQQLTDFNYVSNMMALYAPQEEE